MNSSSSGALTWIIVGLVIVLLGGAVAVMILIVSPLSASGGNNDTANNALPNDANGSADNAVVDSNGNDNVAIANNAASAHTNNASANNAPSDPVRPPQAGATAGITGLVLDRDTGTPMGGVTVIASPDPTDWIFTGQLITDNVGPLREWALREQEAVREALGVEQDQLEQLEADLHARQRGMSRDATPRDDPEVATLIEQVQRSLDALESLRGKLQHWNGVTGFLNAEDPAFPLSADSALDSLRASQRNQVTLRAAGESNPVRRVATSAPDGTFTIENVTPGFYGVIAQSAKPAPGVMSTSTAMVALVGEAQAEVTLYTQPVCVVVGTVTDKDGTPIEGAQVRVGTFSTALPEDEAERTGAWMQWAQQQGLPQNRGSLRVWESGPQEPAGTGTDSAASDGSAPAADPDPLPESALRERAGSAVTDADGNYRALVYEPTADFAVLAWADGYGHGHSDVLTASPGAEIDVPAIMLQGLTGLIVTVVSEVDEKPVAGARVRALTEETRNRQWVASDTWDGMWDGDALQWWQIDMRTTDGKGRARFYPLQPGTYFLRARAQGHLGSDEARVTIVADQTVEVTLMLRAGASVDGIVVDADGLPLAGVTVAATMAGDTSEPDWMRRFGRSEDVATETVKDANGKEHRVSYIWNGRGMTTGDDGRFVLTGIPDIGLVNVSASMAAYATATVTDIDPKSDAAHGIQIVLTPSASIAGRVVFEGTSASPTQFSVRLIDVNAEENPNQRRWGGAPQAKHERTKQLWPDGTFLFVDVPPGEWIIEASADGYTASKSEPVKLAEAQQVTGVIVELREGGKVAGRVVSSATRSPVVGALIIVSDPEFEDVAGWIRGNRDTWESDEGIENAVNNWGNPDGRKRSFARTDENGEFLLTNVPDGEITLSAIHPDYVSATSETVTAKPGQTTTGVTIEMSPGGTIEGIVLDRNGSPMAGETVMVFNTGFDYSSNATSDDVGEFRISGLAPDSYYVGLQNEGQQGWIDQSTAEIVTITGEETVYVEIGGIPDGATIIGRVLDNGSPLAEAQVMCMGPLRMFSPVATDEDGGFRFEGLKPGEYTLFVMGYEGLMRVVRITNQPEVNVEINIIDGTIRGTITNEAGEPIGSARVVVSSVPRPGGSAMVRGLQEFAGQDHWSDENGEYEITGVVEGEYRLIVRAEGYAHQDRRISITPGATFVADLVMQSGSGAIKGSVTGYQPEQVFGWVEGEVRLETSEGETLSLSQQEHFLNSGEFTFSNLAPGLYHVVVTANGAVPVRVNNVRVDAGQTTDVSIELQQAAAADIVINGDWASVPPEALDQMQVDVLNAQGQPIERRYGLMDLMGAMQGEAGEVLTDTSLTLKLRNLPIGPHRVRIQIPGYATILQPMNLAAGETTTVTTSLTPG